MAPFVSGRIIPRKALLLKALGERRLAHLQRWDHLGESAINPARHGAHCIMHRFSCSGLICSG